MRISVGVIGASGYAGGELLRLLLNHPDFDVTYISAGSNAGEPITSVHPSLTSYAGQSFQVTSTELANTCDLLFIALPHGESAKIISGIDSRVKIVDLGADFRLQNSDSWSKYYGGTHAGTWAYGLADSPKHKELIKQSTRIANPGCYATAIALAAAPALSAGYMESNDLVVVAASGTTGAGRSAKVNLLGSEVMNSLSSYKFGGVHQHTPEIEESLSLISGKEVKLSFTPILAPMPRGILATVTSKIAGNISAKALRESYINYFADSDFVHILPEGVMPATSSVLGTNHAHIQVAIDEHTERVVISCAIDNLGKGAAAQAIHNANLMHGLDASAGLHEFGVR
jgi:N-acetyl-gamma-glutamyl-phosphate reductase